MTKQELVAKIAKETGVTKTDTNMMVDAIAKAIADALAEGEAIRLPSLGSFRVGEVSETTRYNGLAGGTQTYPAHKRVRFKPCKELRERVKGS